jgi:uncharacterized protein (TIGR00369 family)
MTFNETLILFMEEKIPFNRFLGMEVVSIGEGEAIMRIPMQPHLTGDPFRPALHGGVISALADTVGGLAVFTRIDLGMAASTVDLRVDYLRPGRVDVDLYARAVVQRVGNRVAVTHTVVYQDDVDAPVATAAAVYNVVQLKNLSQMQSDAQSELDPGDPHS